MILTECRYSLCSHFAGLGSCVDPLPADPPAFFAVNPCHYENSTASTDRDAVMLIGPSSTLRVITVEALGADTRLLAYTSCPDDEQGISKVLISPASCCFILELHEARSAVTPRQVYTDFYTVCTLYFRLGVHGGLCNTFAP